MSISLSLSELSITLVSPIVMSRVSLMPPLGLDVLSQPVLPLLDEGVKQILWSPASWAVNVNLPPEAPFCVTIRWLLSKSSCLRPGQ